MSEQVTQIYEDENLVISVDSRQYIVYDRNTNQYWYFSRLDALLNALLEWAVKKNQKQLRQFVVDVEDVRRYLSTIASAVH